MKGKKSLKTRLKNAYQTTVSALKRVFMWIKRSIFGDEKEGVIEKIERPSKLVRQAFFRRKTAVGAVVTLVGLFLFVFIVPMFLPMDVNYTDPLQQNVAPIYSMRAVPRKLKKSVALINGFSDFTVGVSGSGETFVWGNTKNRLQKTDLKDIPDEAKNGVLLAAAGKDHILVLTQTGQIVGWGDKSCGQYGGEPVLNAVPMPQHLLNGVNAEEVRSIVCGFQTSALVMEDGRAFVWGNQNTTRNLSDFATATGVEKISFTNSAVVALKKDGTVDTGSEPVFASCISSKNGRQADFNAYLVGRNVIDLATSGKCVAVVTDEGELIVAGAFENGEDELPAFEQDERIRSLRGGTRHFVGITERGGIYAWGHNAYGQCNVKTTDADEVFAGALQTYVIKDGKLQESVGLKGYLMGTDGRGRDVFVRIAHGGRMTMTIGGVAVLVSSVIGVVIGCISGYFGGKVDTILMRITEIFSSVPFLPFAMLLSQIIKNYNVSETMRIFIIMLILGALSWTGLARMIRGQVLAEREKEFVLAARAIGVKERKIAFKHVLPNVASVILVSMTLAFASCLLTESSLSYLGFGVQQPQPTWGNMLNGANNSTVIQNYWWQWLFPALFLSLATVSINVIGDSLRDALDPKGKEEN